MSNTKIIYVRIIFKTRKKTQKWASYTSEVHVPMFNISPKKTSVTLLPCTVIKLTYSKYFMLGINPKRLGNKSVPKLSSMRD